jgi:hypothetical protein
LRHAPVKAKEDPEAPMLLAILENEIKEAEYQATMDLPIALDETEKTENINAWRTVGVQALND